MKILVTGDRGYIGAVLVPLLLSKNYQVVGFDTEYFKKEILPSEASYTKITKDIRDIQEGDLNGIEAIIHLSALSNDPMGEIDGSLTEQINFASTIRLAQMAKKLV